MLNATPFDSLLTRGAFYPSPPTELLTTLSAEELESLKSQFDNSPLEENSDLPEVTEEQPSRLTRCQIIKRIALIVLGILCLAATLIGIFATVGLHGAGAPHFMVNLAKGLRWDFIAYILTTAGPTYLFGLGIYFLVERKRREGQNLRL